MSYFWPSCFILERKRDCACVCVIIPTQDATTRGSSALTTIQQSPALCSNGLYYLFGIFNYALHKLIIDVCVDIISLLTLRMATTRRKTRRRVHSLCSSHCSSLACLLRDSNPGPRARTRVTCVGSANALIIYIYSPSEHRLYKCI